MSPNKSEARADGAKVSVRVGDQPRSGERLSGRIIQVLIYALVGGGAVGAERAVTYLAHQGDAAAQAPTLADKVDAIERGERDRDLHDLQRDVKIDNLDQRVQGVAADVRRLLDKLDDGTVGALRALARSGRR